MSSKVALWFRCALVLFSCLAIAISGCGTYPPSSTKQEGEGQASCGETGVESADGISARSFRGDAPQPAQQESMYVDPRWPTRNSELLAIPEENRYYNAWNHVWTTCTVAGPVVNVYQARDSAGMPIFISIGEQYPSSNCVTLVVWADAYYDFERMINAVDDGGAWLSVTGYLSEYNGGLQFDISDGYVEYTWWEDVR